MCKAEGFPENHSHTNKNSIFKEPITKNILSHPIHTIHQAIVSVAWCPSTIKDSQQPNYYINNYIT